MDKTVFIIHGWGGNPHKDWFLWLKKELEKKHYQVYVPQMPNTNHPKIRAWVNHLNKFIQNPNQDTYFIGHSIGCQTILRYLQQLPGKIKIGGCILVAGWFNLINQIEEEKEIAYPWLNTKIEFDKIKSHCSNFISILSDNDPYVPLTDAKIFQHELNAKIIIEHQKGHLSGEDGILELPIVVKELLKIS